MKGILGKIRIDKKELGTALLIAIFWAFAFGIFAPTEMYFVNAEEYWFDILTILPLIGLTAFLIFGVILILQLVPMLIGHKPGRAATVVFLILGLDLYVQGNFMQLDYGKFGDETIDWSGFGSIGVYNTVAWCGIGLVIVMLIIRFGYERLIRISKTVLIVIMLTLTVTMAVLVIRNPGVLRIKNDVVATDLNEVAYSKSDNYIVLVLDTFDSKMLNQIMEEEGGDKYRDALEDFTFFENTVGTFTLTDFSIPHILTGEKYLNQEEYGDFIDKAYPKSPFLNRLWDENYNVNIYTTVTLPQNAPNIKVSNWHRVKYATWSNQGLWVRYIRIVAFKYLPHYLKRYMYFDSQELEAFKYAVAIDYGTELLKITDPFDWNNSRFYGANKQIEALMDDKMFHFIHIQGVHSRRNFNEELESVEVESDEDELSVADSSKACVMLTKDYIDQLKRIGIYDDAVIVVMADHGTAALQGLAQRPVLLIKGRNERHPLSISDSPISYDDMQTGFLNLLDGKTGEAVFGIPADAKRDRYFYFTKFEGAMKLHSKNGVFIEYVNSKEDGNNISKYKATGNVY